MAHIKLEGMQSVCLIISTRVSLSWPQRPLGGRNQRQVLLALGGSELQQASQ